MSRFLFWLIVEDVIPPNIFPTKGSFDGVPGVVMTIHTFGDYMEKFHPHLHALASDGLSRKLGTFYVMPKVGLGPLEEIFVSRVLKMIKAKVEAEQIMGSNR